MENVCTETRFCYSVRRERIHLHYSAPSSSFLSVWEICECVVSTATDTDWLSLMVISNQFQITVWTFWLQDWIWNKNDVFACSLNEGIIRKSWGKYCSCASAARTAFGGAWSISTAIADLHCCFVMGQQSPVLLCSPMALSSLSIVNALEPPDTTLPSGALSSSQASLIASAQGCRYLCRWESVSIFSDTPPDSSELESRHIFSRLGHWWHSFPLPQLNI